MAQEQRSLEERFYVDQKTTVTPAYWNQFIAEVALRLRGLEAIKISWDEVSRVGIEVALARINESLGPAAERIGKIAEIGFLVAPSDSSVTLALGPADFTIIEGDQRELFRPSPFVAVTRSTTPDDYAIARTLAYDRETGVLQVNIEAVAGEPGPHADWEIGALAGSVMASLDALADTQAARDTTLGYRNTAQGAATTATTKAGEAATARNDAVAARNEMRSFIAPVGVAPPASPGLGMFWYDGTLVRVYDGEGFSPAVTASIGGLRMQGGTFGAAPSGIINVGGGFSSALLFVNGVLAKEGVDYTAASPNLTVLAPVQGDEWFYWAYQAIDAADYYTKEETNAPARLAAHIAGGVDEPFADTAVLAARKADGSIITKTWAWFKTVFLPKAGGTMLGDLALDNGTNDTPAVRFNDPVNNTYSYFDQFAEGWRVIGSYRGGAAAELFRIVIGAATVAGTIVATAAQWRSKLAGKLLTADGVWSGAAGVNWGAALNGLLTLDFNTFYDAHGTLAGNVTFQIVANFKAGQKGVITLINPGGAYTLSINTAIGKTANGSPLTIGAGENKIGYFCDGLDGKVFFYIAGKAVA